MAKAGFSVVHNRVTDDDGACRWGISIAVDFRLPFSLEESFPSDGGQFIAAHVAGVLLLGAYSSVHKDRRQHWEDALWDCVARHRQGVKAAVLVAADWNAQPHDNDTAQAMGLDIFAPTSPTRRHSGRIIDYFLGADVVASPPEVMGLVLGDHWPVDVEICTTWTDQPVKALQSRGQCFVPDALCQAWQKE